MSADEGACCTGHGPNCAPGGLCCNGCPEAVHDFLGYSLGIHADGTACVAYDDSMRVVRSAP